MKHSPISVLLALHICIVQPLSAQLTLTLGVDTALTQTANTNGNADAAFDTWTSSIIAAAPSISTWSTATDHELGTIGGFQMDTGISASSPFGAAPSPINVNVTTPTTLTHTSTGFTYTVHSVRQFDTTPPPSSSPSGWNLLPAGSTLLGSTTGILREQANAANRAATLADALFEYRVESPAAQAGAEVSPDGRSTWGFDGLNISSNNNRRGFVLSFSSPLSAFGFYAADFESTDTDGFWGLAAIFDASGNLIGQQVIDYPGSADGNDRESFIGLRSTLQNISYAVFFVGSTNTNPNAVNRRQNSYAFGGFTFLTSELVPEPSVVVGVSLAALLVGVAIYRLRRAARANA